VTRLRAAYRDLAAGGWPVMLFVAAWTVLVVTPLALMLVYSLFRTQGFATDFTPGLETWRTFFDSGRWQVVVRTVRIGLTVTLIVMAISLPFAIWLAKGCRSASVRAALVTLITIPFFLDVASRTIVWRTLLGSEGAVNTLLGVVGIPPQAWLLYSEFAVHFGMVIVYFPTMVLPIMLVLTLIDDDLLEASGDLGASRWRTFVDVLLPLALPGIAAGVVFTMVPAMADVVVPQIMGGFNVNMLGNSVDAALDALKYPMAAALSSFVVAVLLVLLGVLALVLRRVGAGAALFRALDA